MTVQEVTFNDTRKDTYNALMTDYAAGTLDSAQMLIMDCHLALNSDARRLEHQCLAVGASMLDLLCDPVAMSSRSLNDVLRELDKQDKKKKENPSKLTACAVLPNSLQHYLDGQTVQDLRWKNIVSGIQYIDIPVPIRKPGKAQLLKMDAGKSVLEHSHEGMELTLVLDGAFHDETGIYRRGDIVIHEGEELAHKPFADLNEGCICLAVTTAPLHFTGFFGSILNRFMR